VRHCRLLPGGWGRCVRASSNSCRMCSRLDSISLHCSTKTHWWCTEHLLWRCV